MDRVSAAEYYGDAAVGRRVLEFCGGSDDAPPTAAYVARFDPAARPFPTWEGAIRRPASPDTIAAGSEDLSRSLWDVNRLLYFLELDYQNVDQRDEPFRHPADVLLRLEPTYQAVRRVFARLNLDAATFVSGRGYHFVGAVALDDPIVDMLAALVPAAPGWWHSLEARRPEGVTASMPVRQARAADGLGLLVEYTAHLVLREARRASPTPVVFNGTTVGSGLNGRACVSIDFSHGGDPLDARHVRTGFSTYRWHQYRPDIFGDTVARQVAPLAVVPRGEDGLLDLMRDDGRSLARGRALAKSTTAALPDIGDGIGTLLTLYGRSSLSAFHRRFIEELGQLTWAPSELAPPALPACVTRSIENPNDLLLQPAHLQHLTRMLLVGGWQPARIAALVRSCYEADHGWGDRWQRLHAPTRAAFDVRVFAGMVETGLDTLTDFNCVSTQEKGMCPGLPCDHNLLDDRAELEDRRTA
jgi:hypothetical protein